MKANFGGPKKVSATVWGFGTDCVIKTIRILSPGYASLTLEMGDKDKKQQFHRSHRNTLKRL